MFVVKPGDKRLVKGSSVKFDCLAAGNPLPTLFWMKEAHGSGILLPGDGQEHVRVTPEGSLVIGEYNYSATRLSDPPEVRLLQM